MPTPYFPPPLFSLATAVVALEKGVVGPSIGQPKNEAGVGCNSVLKCRHGLVSKIKQNDINREKGLTSTILFYKK